MDPQDEPDRPVRPPPPRMPYVALQERAGRLRTTLSSVGGLPEQLRRWDDGRSTSFVPSHETVEIDVRRHPFLLAWPAFRTVFGGVAVLAGVQLVPILVFALTVVGWAQVRVGGGLRKSLTTAALASLALVLLSGWLGVALALLGLLLWAVEDVADWACDRLVVTNKRIYRRYGVITAHSPSIALTAIAFIDASVPPVGRLLHYGTLRLDSVAQRDAPLARLDLIPDVIAVSHEILRLRSLALPRFPGMPH